MYGGANMPNEPDDVTEKEIKNIFKKGQKVTPSKQKRIQEDILKKARTETGLKDILILFAVAWAAIKVPSKIFSFLTKQNNGGSK